VNIPRQLQQMGVVFTDNGFVSVLKKMTITLMSAVIIDPIPC
jgi:hypothetical protein